MTQGVGKRNGDVSCWWGKSMREMCGLWNTLHPPKFAISILFEFFLSPLIVCSHTTSCAPCAKTKAAYKPFDVKKA